MNQSSRIISPALTKIFLFVYFSALILYCLVKPPFRDTFYYWQWGKHLALSYFDGPPMIAYMFRASTSIFGDTLFALNIVGVICLALTGYWVYKAGKLMLDKETGLIAALLWLLFPITSSKLLVTVTYDTPLSLFWAMSVYFAARFIRYQKNADLYWAACAIGLMLLSKYSGIVLVFGILAYFIISPQHRAVFKNKHFYIAACLSLAILSPVIIWNYQHDWISIKYLTTVHKLANPHPMHFVGNFLGNYFIFALIPLLATWQHKLKTRPSLINLMICISVVFFMFWLFSSLSSLVFMNYLAPATISLSLIAAYYIKNYHYKKTCLVIMAVFFIASVWRIGVDYDQTDPLAYSLAQKAIHTYDPDASQAILSYDFATTEQITFWLKSPQIAHPLPCYGQDNQYQYWDKEFTQALNLKQIKQALFMTFVTPGTNDPTQPPACIMQYFNTCKALPELTLQRRVWPTSKLLTKQIYVYQCNNS
jgi:hypothetical protein